MSPLTIYKASAGSGKTHALTREYLSLLFMNPGRHRNILAVTFTNKAAGEMKMRILTWLHKLSQVKSGENPKELTELLKRIPLDRETIVNRSGVLLNTILNDYSAFSVGTIDRFFQMVIRAFTREIGIQPGYNLELDTDRVLGAAVDRLFMNVDKDTDLQEWLIRYAEEKIENAENWNFREEILRLGNQLFREEFQALRLSDKSELMTKESLAGYRFRIDGIEKNACETITALSSEAIREIGMNGYALSDFSGGARSVAGFFLTASEDPRYELSEARFRAIPDPSKWLKRDSPDGLETLVKEKLQPLLKKIFDAQIVANSCSLVRKNLYTLGILSDISKSINQYTKERNLFLLNDANRFLKGIIADNPAPFIFERVGNRFENIMLDEFQDTSLFQWENFKPLLENSLGEGEQCLVVGDVKQSVYRWRNSDWRILSTDVERDFRHQPVRIENLSENRRSLEQIVRFNNSLFQVAPLLIRNLLDLELINSGFLPGRVNDWLQIFENAYRDVVQEIPDGEDRSGGYIECRVHPSENSSQFYEKALERLTVQVEKLRSAGYLPGEIAILVRKQSEGSRVAEKLLEYTRDNRTGFEFRLISNESLVLAGNNAVRLIVSILKYFSFPNDSVNRAELKYLVYLCGLTEEKNLRKIFDDGTPAGDILPAEFVSRIPHLKRMPLFELVEWIIRILHLNERVEDLAYIQAFQDLILESQRREPQSIYSFLHYWEEKGSHKSVTISEEMNAIRIMTIHKSKGLQFKAVIVPFCNWEVTTDSRKDTLLWCDPSDTSVSGISMVPVKFSSGLKNSVFLACYAEELVKGYLDNLNLLYVAFTRAQEALFVGLPPSGKNGIKQIGELVIKSFDRKPVQEPFIREWHAIDEEHPFLHGELKRRGPGAIPSTEWSFEHYPVFVRSEKLNVKLQSRTYFMREDGSFDSKIGFGNIMHRIFSDIRTTGDIREAVDNVLKEGLVNTRQVDELVRYLEKALSRTEVAAWFQPGLKVIRERDILTEEGSIYRPDRVILETDCTFIVDFKFGSGMEKRYHDQVGRYVGLLRKMGYPKVKGYIWYVILNEIIMID
ncbi:MAG: UvrD-helicase domain-containing protein [Bacteroidales bacterium]|nr:UvrD-helicase domain-containing protein [Bacteroidales bacterium]MBN2697891.1 UvrD-helicase domain-containing protein [Bacteroidales bacterium]